MPHARDVSLLESLKLFVLPPLLTLAVVAVSLMGLMSHLTRASVQTSYAVAKLKLGSPCWLCHDGAFTRVPFRLSSRR